MKQILGFNNLNNVVYFNLRKSIKQRQTDMRIISKESASDNDWQRLREWTVNQPALRGFMATFNVGDETKEGRKFREALDYLLMDCAKKGRESLQALRDQLLAAMDASFRLQDVGERPQVSRKFIPIIHHDIL